MNETAPARRTGKLLKWAAASLLGIPIFVLLHNLFYALGGPAGHIPLLSQFLSLLSAASFVLAVVVCPAAMAACLLWALVDRCTTRGTWTQRLLLLTLPLAAVLATSAFGRFLDLSRRETDPAAGFNGSFEVMKSGYPANWYIHHTPLEKGDATLDFDEADPVDGARSLRIVVKTDKPLAGWRAPGLFQVTDAEEGATYRVSFWLKNEGCDNRLLITSETPESREPRTPITETLGPEQTGEGDWKQFAYDYTVPPHYSNIRFELTVGTPGTVWIDNVRIERL